MKSVSIYRKLLIASLTVIVRFSNQINVVSKKISDYIIGRWKVDLSIGKAQSYLKNCQTAFNNSLEGKRIVNFGDSIFGSYRKPNDISSYLAQLTKAKVYNVGFGGCRMSTHSIAGYDAFSMHKLAEAIVKNDWNSQEEALHKLPWGDGKMPSLIHIENYKRLKNMDFSAVDIITIAYGTNDWSAGVALEKHEDPRDVDTYLGALRYSIEMISLKYPSIKIVICTPVYRYWLDDNNDFKYDSDTFAVNGYKLPEFVIALKRIGEEYGVPVIDNYYCSGINYGTRGNCFLPIDGIHPNALGRAMIAANVAKELYNIFGKE